MFGSFIVTTSTEGLSPLGTAPQRSYELITGTIRSHDDLTDAHAALFAEPVSTQYGDRFDWYSISQGPARQLSVLEDEAEQQARDQLEKLVGEIRAVGEALSESKDVDQQRLGEALVNAVEIPDEESIYVLSEEDGPQPILVNWGWIADRQRVVRGVLSGADVRDPAAQPGAAARAAVSAAAAQAASGAEVSAARSEAISDSNTGDVWKWWLFGIGWLILGLILLTILYLLIEPCALRFSASPSHCPGEQASASVLDRENAFLLDQVAAVEREIGVIDRACQPPVRNRADLDNRPDSVLQAYLAAELLARVASLQGIGFSDGRDPVRSIRGYGEE